MTDTRDGASGELAPLSPGQLAWRQFRRSALAMAGARMLVVMYVIALLAPFLSPYAENDMDRGRFFHPPTRLHWFDGEGRWYPAGFVYGTLAVGERDRTFEIDETRPVALKWFTRGVSYRLFGVMPADIHLYGVALPERIYLLGADALGRDVLTRVLHGAQVSLTVGLVGILISFSIGLLLGGISGYFGGWIDALIMRTTEILLSIPALYLIVALRGIFPAVLSSRQVYLAIVVILAFIGWAGLARVIRGMVLGLKRAEYVLAAEALGLSRLRIIVRHILPNTASFVIVAATVAVPGYILGEVFLSFLGMGVQEPSASWGNMLAAARSYSVMTRHPWVLFSPAAAIFITVMAFNVFGDGLRDALDPRKVSGGKG